MRAGELIAGPALRQIVAAPREVYLALESECLHLSIITESNLGALTRTDWKLSPERIVASHNLGQGTFPAVRINFGGAYADAFKQNLRGLLSALAREENSLVPVGVSVDAKISDDLKFSSETDLEHVGITCAIFVLAIFDFIQLPLLDLKEWEADEESYYYYDLIRGENAGPNQEYLIERAWQVPRFSPIRVAAAGLVGGFPSTREALMRVEPTIECECGKQERRT